MQIGTSGEEIYLRHMEFLTGAGGFRRATVYPYSMILKIHWCEVMAFQACVKNQSSHQSQMGRQGELELLAYGGRGGRGSGTLVSFGAAYQGKSQTCLKMLQG